LECQNCSDDLIAGQCPVSPGSVVLGQMIADTGKHTTNRILVGKNAVQPVNELLMNDHREVLAADCQAMGHYNVRVEEVTRLSKVV